MREVTSSNGSVGNLALAKGTDGAKADASAVRVGLYIAGPDLGRRVRQTIRLRWPQAEIISVDATGLSKDAGACELLFLATAAPSLIAEVRESSAAGIVVLSASPGDDDMMEALDAGADDYLDASFTAAQFVARVGALLRRLRRMHQHANGVMKYGPLQIRPETHEAYVHGRELHLTPTEFSLLRHLASGNGNTVTVKSLHKLIWECDQLLYAETLRKYAQRLRKKLNETADSRVDIVAIRGVGYRLAYRS